LRFKRLWDRKWRIPLLLLLAGGAAGIALYIQDWKRSSMPEGYVLERPDAGASSREEEMRISSPYGIRQFLVEVEPRKLTREEIRKRLPELAKELEGQILGENSSLEQVQSPLHLVEELPESPAEIRWSVEEDGPVCQDGTLNQQNLPKEGQLTELTARLQWEEETLIWPVYVRVYPPVRTREELFWEELLEAVEQESFISLYEPHQKLPLEAGGVSVNWSRRQDFRGVSLILLSAAGAFLQIFSAGREEEKKEQRRRSQMEMDYPELVSKLKLYMEAGLTCRAAWMKIAGDYQEKRKTGGRESRYAYEEMVKAGYEMQSGVGELQAYERFARRCRVPCYKKLTGLLAQNLRKGNRGLGELLENEMWQAFENRKALARKQGEEAGTKLLMPMMGMLAVVMVIVIAPALMSMQM
jgi:tight adherence protein C